MPQTLIRAVAALTALLFMSGSARADLLFDGEWENYLGKFYGPEGWYNGTGMGAPTGNDDWRYMTAFWSPAQIDNTWLYNYSQAQDRIQLVEDPTSPKGGLVARFEVRSGDYPAGHDLSERSEMYWMLGRNHKKLPVDSNSGHEFYGISVKVSPDWKSPQAIPANKGGSLWGTFMQLHSPNIFNSPPALDLMAENDFHLNMDSGDLDKVVFDPSAGTERHVKKDSTPVSFSDGDLRRGHWVQFVLEVVWSTEANGMVRIYRRDDDKNKFEQVLYLGSTPTLQTDSYVPKDQADCSTCSLDNVMHYWRIGFYRSTSVGQTNVLWLGPVVRGTSFEEVVKAAFGKP